MHTRLATDVTGESGKSLGRKGRKINARLLQDMRAEGITALPCLPEDLSEAVFADDIFDEESGRVVRGCEANSPVTCDATGQIRMAGIKEFKVIFPETDECGPALSETLRKDSIKTRDQALLAIYRNLRPGDPPTRETATKLFNDMFFDPRKYDFSRVGRMKFNIKLHGERKPRRWDRSVLDASDFYEDHQIPVQAAAQDRDHRRHRPSGQPPGARGRRAIGETVPHRPDPHGAGDARPDDVLPGHVQRVAARPDQRHPCHGSSAGILRLLAAVAVRGPDQPAVGADSQEAAFVPRSRRIVARAGGL